MYGKSIEDINVETSIGRFINYKESSYDAVTNIYREAKTPSLKPAMLLKLILKIQSKTFNRLENVGLSDITDTVGNIKKLKNYKELSKFLESTESILKGINMKSDHYSLARDTLKMLEKNTGNFQKAMKRGRNAVGLLYSTSVMYLLDMSVIISEGVKNAVDTGQDLDKYINSNNKYKKLFKSYYDLINDKDFNKLFSVKLEDITAYAESNVQEDVVDLYGESSILSNLSILKVGLVSVLYKLSAVARYIVYIYYYSKFSVKERVDTVHKSLEYYTATDEGSRYNVASDMDKSLATYKVDLIKSDTETTKEEQTDEVTLTMDDAI